jgi:hypothetical protein
MFELAIDNSNYVVEGPDALVRQFFKHYGHPMRDTKNVIIPDRIREVVSIATVVAYALVFPAGLLVLLWVDDTVQSVWLGYQMYAIMAMLLCRLAGWGEDGTTQHRIATALQVGKEVIFERRVMMTLVSSAFGKAGLARSHMRQLVENHRKSRTVNSARNGMPQQSIEEKDMEQKIVAC